MGGLRGDRGECLDCVGDRVDIEIDLVVENVRSLRFPSTGRKLSPKPAAALTCVGTVVVVLVVIVLVVVEVVAPVVVVVTGGSLTETSSVPLQAAPNSATAKTTIIPRPFTIRECSCSVSRSRGVEKR